MRILFFQDKQAELLRWITMESFCKDTFVDALLRRGCPGHATVGLLVPQEWNHSNTIREFPFFSYALRQWQIPLSLKNQPAGDIFLTRAETVFETDEKQMSELFETVSADILTIQFNPALTASKESVRLTSDNHIVGFRRLYETDIEPAHEPVDWPTITCFRKKVWAEILSRKNLDLNFDLLIRQLKGAGFQVKHFYAGGNLYHLNSLQGVLTFLRESVSPSSGDFNLSSYGDDVTIAAPVWLGENVKIEAGAFIVGPAILSDGVTVESEAIVRCAVLGPGLTVAKGQVINQAVCLKGGLAEIQDKSMFMTPLSSMPPNTPTSESDTFRQWPFFSYARLGKRLFDLLVSIFMLVLLMPIFTVVTMMIKWSSPGPVFYRACRQGRHGRTFNCLKFRTMIVQADRMQDCLRVLNQVDGPQFKIDDDPRISGVGKFLRDTCIDELPQFINVLLGHMSIVGPRPSPENENESCPTWRDARLSVRPGITGPWQIFRTRQAWMDFQEWIYYDTEYVRDLSFKKDMWICWKTAQKLITNFLNQF